jgi:hypothetical protein
MPEAMSQKFTQGAASLGLDLTDPEGTLTRMGAEAAGMSPEDAQALEIAVGSLNPLDLGAMKHAGILFPALRKGARPLSEVKLKAIQKIKKSMAEGDLHEALKQERKIKTAEVADKWRQQMSQVDAERLAPILEASNLQLDETILNPKHPLGEELLKLSERVEGEGGVAVKLKKGDIHGAYATPEQIVLPLPKHGKVDPAAIHHILTHETGHGLVERLRAAGRTRESAQKVEDVLVRAMTEEGGSREPGQLIGEALVSAKASPRMEPMSLDEAARAAAQDPYGYTDLVHPGRPHARDFGRPTEPAYTKAGRELAERLEDRRQVIDEDLEAQIRMEVQESAAAEMAQKEAERLSDFLSRISTIKGQQGLKPRTREILSEVMDLP